MKKNKMMRLASSLLVAVLLTSSVISGTFAKYVTEGSGTDTARVARWGVVVEGSGYLFADTYLKTANTPLLGGSTPDTLSVMSYGALNDDVVAPGTKNDDGLKVTVSGAPEVAVKVTREATVDIVGWTIDTDTFYCPLTFKVDGTDVDFTGATDEAKYEAALKAAIEGAGNKGEQGVYFYNPKTDLTGESVTITWEWPFDGDDVSDTKLGNLAVAPTVTVTVDVRIEQVD